MLHLNNFGSSYFKGEYYPCAFRVSVLTGDIPGRTRPPWLGFSHEHKPYKLVAKPKYSFSPYYKTEMVFNPYLERAFQLKQSQTGLPAIEVFHGTVSGNINSIAENNFNWRLSGRSRGYKHGKGVCFSHKESFTHQFCQGLNKRIIRTRILCRNSSIGYHAQQLPPFGFDSTASPNGNVVVKFEDSEFLPVRIHHYEPYNMQALLKDILDFP